LHCLPCLLQCLPFLVQCLPFLLHCLPLLLHCLPFLVHCLPFLLQRLPFLLQCLPFRFVTSCFFAVFPSFSVFLSLHSFLPDLDSMLHPQCKLSLLSTEDVRRTRVVASLPPVVLDCCPKFLIGHERGAPAQNLQRYHSELRPKYCTTAHLFRPISITSNMKQSHCSPIPLWRLSETP
jgi:hypothetical protein